MTTSPVLSSLTGGVLVASPDSSVREQVLHNFHDRPGPMQEATGGADALVKLESGNWQLLFLDRRLPDLDVEELVEIIKRRFPGTEVVVLDPDSGRPLPKYVVPTVRPIASHEELAPASSSGCVVPLPGMIGQTAGMQRLYRLARLVAPTNTTVLITGPTGTGKELVARAVHQLGPRSARPFVVVNCAAIPEALLESELFGHVRGAFTGAVQTSSGRVLAAQGGTLFLDEVGELPLGLQAKLLRFLDQKEVQRLGSPDVIKADVRVLAATNADLGQSVRQGKFRADLFYRLAAFPLQLPPLAQRVADIRPLAEHFLRTFTDPSGACPAFAPDTIRILEAHVWEGNVRELQQVIERALVLAEGALNIAPEHLYFPWAMGWQSPELRGIARREF